MKAVNIIALLLIVVGALNWGLVGLFNFDLVAAIFGYGGDAQGVAERSTLSSIIYIVVALAGIYGLTFFGRLSQEG